MRFTTVISAVSALAGISAAAPTVPRSFGVPSADGFPSPNQAQLMDIQNLADGTLSNAPPPAKLANGSIAAFQLITFNELFEVAFFSSLIYNITNNVPGYEFDNKDKKTEFLQILTTVLAQEELHAINGQKVLAHFNAFVPQPCQYQFPVSKLVDAIVLAETFTSVVLGTLQDASQGFAKGGDDGPVRAVASVIGQEGEQNGFFRVILGRKPSEKPFLTTSVAAFAFSALQNFVVPNSCPYPLSNIPIPIFPGLQVLTGNGGADVDARDQHLTFSADLTGVAAADKFVGGNGEGLFITYFTGQNLPLSEAIVNVHWSGHKVTFEAVFPYTANVMDGLSIASLTTSNTFAGPDDVPAATLAAPGLIQVYERLATWDGKGI